jgi:hypothetical protein
MSQGLATAPVQKQKLNVYTVMLVISFVALTTGCVFLYLELQRYGKAGDWWNTRDVMAN